MTKKLVQTDLMRSLFGVGEGFVPPTAPNPSVEIFDKITKEMFSTKNLDLKTEVNDAQIMAYSQGRAFARYYKVPLLSEFIKNLSMYSISRGRKGRKEYSDVAKANLQMAGMEEREKRSIPDRIFGK